MAKMLIQHKADRIHHIDTKVLLPGTNEVEVADFEKWSKLPAFKGLIEEGTIVVLESSGGKNLEAADLVKMKEKDAIELVSDTVRAELLEGWLETEKRKKVIEAIEKQLAAIKPGKPEGDEGEKE